MDDRAVFVVDLRAATLERERAGARPPPDEPIDEDIDTLAILHDESDEPLLLPLVPTRDREELDAIARLVRFAVEHDERILTVATRYGGELERRLVFERRLPAWAYDGAVGPLPRSLHVLARRPVVPST